MNAESRRDTIIRRLMDKTRVEFTGYVVDGVQSGCLVWTGPDSGTGRGGGYGRIKISGQTCAVHLVAAVHYFGYIPGNKHVDHKCNNRRCWNPEHLQIVTPKKNQALRAKRAKGKT